MVSKRLMELFASIDAKDIDSFLTCLSDDAVFRFANAEPHIGKSDIGGAVEGFLASIAASTHTVRRVWEDPESIACHGDVTYTRHDGSAITLPFANVMYLNDDGNKIREYLVHIDTTLLHQP